MCIIYDLITLSIIFLMACDYDTYHIFKFQYFNMISLALNNYNPYVTFTRSLFKSLALKLSKIQIVPYS